MKIASLNLPLHMLFLISSFSKHLSYGEELSVYLTD
jgi:hypothetical protein